MDEATRQQIRKEIERLKGKPIGRLSSFWTTLNLAAPILMPVLIGVVVFVVAYFACAAFGMPPNYGAYVALAVGIVAMFPTLIRNFRFLDFVEDYLEDRGDENSPP